MSIHQIIYTSCMRGISGVNDGQQVFSHDEQFEYSGDDDVRSLFSYTPPSLKPGEIMTSETAKTFPRSFIFRKLENGNCGLAYNTYLGRDYMGESGRFGNWLSHVIVGDEQEFSAYPCEYYGASFLRDHMEFEEVNNPEPPAFLPVPVIGVGNVIDVDKVLDFLKEDGRLEAYKNMLAAVLAFERECKRVVICDTPENIVMWIAAVEYALPLKNARSINFSTYDYAPELSASQICGVAADGTKYNSESSRLHFTFDFLCGECCETDKDSEYFNFIDTAFSLSFDIIRDFHNFLDNGYTYSKADEEIYSAYGLYTILFDGLMDIDRNKLESALGFASDYAIDKEKTRIAETLLFNYDDLLSADRWTYLRVLKFILSIKNALRAGEFTAIKNIAIDKIFSEFLNSDITEDIFTAFYNDVEVMYKEFGYSLSFELLQKYNRDKLFTVMKKDAARWKIAFILRIVSTYAKENKIPVSDIVPDMPVGAMYSGILASIHSKDSSGTFYGATCILDRFSDNCADFVNMTLNIEGMLLDLPDSAYIVADIWKYFGDKMLVKHKDSFNTANGVFAGYDRYEQIFMLYNLQLDAAVSGNEAEAVFNSHYKDFAMRNKKYVGLYGDKVISAYYEKLDGSNPDSAKAAMINLLRFLLKEKKDIDFSDALVKKLVSGIPVAKPSKENEKLIQDAYEYTYNFKRKRISGRLLLLVMGLVIEGIKFRKQISSTLEQLETLTGGEAPDLSHFTDKGLDNYFEWILPTVCRVAAEKDEMTAFYKLFRMPAEYDTEYFEECAKHYLKQCKDEKEYTVFAEYFGFVCSCGSDSARNAIGVLLRKFSKGKFAEIDRLMREYHKKDAIVLKYWDGVKEVAEESKSFINNISDFFKKKKD